MKLKFAVLILVLFIISITVSPSAIAQDEQPINPIPTNITTIRSLEDNIIDLGTTGETAIYLVRLPAPPLVTYKGHLPGLSATSPRSTGEAKLNVNSRASQAYTSYLISQQNLALDTMETMLERTIEVVYHYYVANNGFAIKLTAQEAALISQIPEIVFIQKDFEREIMTDNGPTWIGAPGLWDGTNVGGSAALPNSQGEGIIVGIIDTGINPSNPSFAEVGPIDGYVHTNPLSDYVGVCAGGNSHPPLLVTEN